MAELLINFDNIIASIIATSIIAAVGLLIKSNIILNKIVLQVGSNHPPEGILGRITQNETNIKEIRDWVLREGFDRRIKNREHP